MGFVHGAYLNSNEVLRDALEKIGVTVALRLTRLGIEATVCEQKANICLRRWPRSRCSLIPNQSRN
jgi:hypothetical protein